ncbi:MAG: hypothetical protein CH6_0793 [Candidatus Kapaibacterium sp.]|nr:MAG: hypothetical protein CH6_0793 [Candidatus Kapabacteria bacterium]
MIFDPANKEKLDNEERRRILPPEEILLKSGLTAGSIIADIGCGIGYFTIPAGRIVGANGKVYACDVSDEMLEELKKRVQAIGLTNIETYKSSEYEIPLDSDVADFLLLSNVLHEPNDRERFLREATRILKNGGKLILIDWLKKEMEEGPPFEERLSAEEIETLLTLCNYEVLERETIAGKYYYYLAVKK